MWSKALLIAAPAALFIAAPAPAHADETCTALANDVDAYNQCMVKMNVHCKATGGFELIKTATCTYPDGGRDECTVHFALFGQGIPVDTTCTYVPPGAP